MAVVSVKVLSHQWLLVVSRELLRLSNEVLYANSPQGESKLPEARDLDFKIHLI